MEIVETIDSNESPALIPAEPNRLNFIGQGTDLLGIMLMNWVLTAFTFGLYYPWARVKTLRFMYQNAYLNDTPFVFSGTGKELFKGFIKLFVVLIIIYGSFIAAAVSQNMALMMSVYFGFLVLLGFLVPLAIHGALRYRLSRTSWRGIHFGYRGDRGRLVGEFLVGYVITFFTLGLYQSWFVNALRTYIIGNMRFGSIYFGYDGNGGSLFWINFKGFFLSIITLGIYYFWYRTEYMNYFAKHTYLEQNGQRYYLKPDFSGSEFFGLMIVNLFLTLFTFGLGTPWVIIRTAKFIINNIELPQEIDFNLIAQTEDEFKDATGEDVIDFLDLGIV